jgi:ribonuclease P protein component
MRMPGWAGGSGGGDAARAAKRSDPPIRSGRTVLKDDHETHLPTEQQASQTDARLPCANEHAGRATGPQAAAGQGPQAADGLDPVQAATLKPAGADRSQRFPGQFRLRKRHEFLALQREGRRQTLPHFVVITRLKQQSPSRLGITTSRKVGGAPTRNRVRRLVREFFRRHASLAPPRDVLIIARPTAGTVRYIDVADELTRALHLAPGAE